MNIGVCTSRGAVAMDPGDAHASEGGGEYAARALPHLDIITAAFFQDQYGQRHGLYQQAAALWEPVSTLTASHTSISRFGPLTRLISDALVSGLPTRRMVAALH